MKRLDPEEREILDAYRKGQLERLALSLEEIERYRRAAKAVPAKDERVER